MSLARLHGIETEMRCGYAALAPNAPRGSVRIPSLTSGGANRRLCAYRPDARLDVHDEDVAGAVVVSGNGERTGMTYKSFIRTEFGMDGTATPAGLTGVVFRNFVDDASHDFGLVFQPLSECVVAPVVHTPRGRSADLTLPFPHHLGDSKDGYENVVVLSAEVVGESAVSVRDQVLDSVSETPSVST